MKQLFQLLILLALIPLATAITITAPTEDITTTTLPAQVTATWDANHTQYTVVLTRNGTPHTNTTTTTNSIGLTLQAGLYELTVASNTTQDTTSFTVAQEQPPVQLTLSTNKQTYETQETVQLAVTSTRTVTATLDILRESEVVDTYTIPLESSVNLIYIPEQPGAYQARIQADGQTATATFTVIEKPPLEINFVHQPAHVNRPTQFNATATGGTAPYTYQWLFSDETTSSGRNVLHYFFEEGPHSATLIVTDAEGEQKSTTQNFEVTTPSFTLDVVVRKTNGDLVQGATVRLTQTGYNETKTTASSGLVTFEQLRGNYTLTLTHQGEQRITETIEMVRDRTKVYTLQPTQEIEEEVVEEEVEEKAVEETPQEPEQTSEVNQIVPTQATTQNTLQEKRAQAREELTQRRFNLQLSATKDEVLKTLGLYDEFDQALRRIDTATETQLANILAQAPKDVRIRDEQTRITYPEPQDVEDFTEQFLEVRGVQDERLARQYRHSIQETSQDVIIRTTTKSVTIVYENTNKDYVIIKKEVTAPEDSYAVEFIPQTLAQDVSRLSIQGDYDVLRANPVLRFHSEEYGYWAETRTGSPGYTLVVPEQLQDPPGLLGFVTIRLGEANPMRGILYIFLLGIFLVGIVAGGKVSKKRQQSHLFEDFTELTHQALDAINQGRGAQAAHITPEIIAIYQELPESQQATVRDIIEHLKINEQEQHFIQTLNNAYETINANGDINTISSAYETTLTAYEALPEQLKEQLKTHIDQLHTYLDNYTQ